jgi:hypothetical protein
MRVPKTNRGNPLKLVKNKTQTNLNTRTKRTCGSTARQTIGPATPGRNLAPLEGYGAAPVQIRLARGSVAPSSEHLSRSRVGRPSSGTPPRSGGWTPPLARGPATIENQAPPRASSRLARGVHRPAASIPAPPAGAFNALTPQVCATTPTHLGITPWRCSTDSLGKTIPSTVRHCVERPVSAPWHCAAYFCTTNTSSPRKGTAEPSKGGKYFSHVYTGLHHDVRPAGTVFSVSISPVWPSPPLQRHCNAAPGTAAPSPTLLRRTGTGHRHARHCASYGLPSTAPSSRPTGSGRTSTLYATTLEAAPVREWNSPRRPARGGIRQDNRLLHGVVRHASTRS